MEESELLLLDEDAKLISNQPPRSVFTIKNNLETVRYVLSKPLNTRSEIDLEKLIKIFYEGNFFKEISAHEFMKEIVNLFTIVTHDFNYVLCQEGDSADCFWIVLSGYVDLYTKKDKGDFDLEDYQHKFRLHSGESQDEQSLIAEKNRSYTVICSKVGTEQQQLTRVDYYQLLKTYKEGFYSEIRTIYDECLQFRGISKEVKQQLASRSYVAKYPANSVIIRQGEFPMNLYIIKKGSLKILRKIQKMHVNSWKTLRDKNMTEFDLMPEELIMELEDLQEKGHVCDYELVNQVAMQNTILTSQPSDIIYVSVYEIMAALSTIDVKTLQANVKKFPSDCEVIEQYLTSLHWTRFRDSLSNNIQFIKKHKKNQPCVKQTRSNSTLPKQSDDILQDIITTNYRPNKKKNLGLYKGFKNNQHYNRHKKGNSLKLERKNLARFPVDIDENLSADDDFSEKSFEKKLDKDDACQFPISRKNTKSDEDSEKDESEASTFPLKLNKLEQPLPIITKNRNSYKNRENLKTETTRYSNHNSNISVNKDRKISSHITDISQKDRILSNECKKKSSMSSAQRHTYANIIKAKDIEIFERKSTFISKSGRKSTGSMRSLDDDKSISDDLINDLINNKVETLKDKAQSDFQTKFSPLELKQLQYSKGNNQGEFQPVDQKLIDSTRELKKLNKKNTRGVLELVDDKKTTGLINWDTLLSKRKLSVADMDIDTLRKRHSTTYMAIPENENGSLPILEKSRKDSKDTSVKKKDMDVLIASSSDTRHKSVLNNQTKRKSSFLLLNQKRRGSVLTYCSESEDEKSQKKIIIKKKFSKLGEPYISIERVDKRINGQGLGDGFDNDLMSNKLNFNPLTDTHSARRCKNRISTVLPLNGIEKINKKPQKNSKFLEGFYLPPPQDPEQRDNIDRLMADNSKKQAMTDRTYGGATKIMGHRKSCIDEDDAQLGSLMKKKGYFGKKGEYYKLRPDNKSTMIFLQNMIKDRPQEQNQQKSDDNKDPIVNANENDIENKGICEIITYALYTYKK